MYKVGDEVVILDADKISKARELEFENGVEYEVVEVELNGTPVLKHNEGDQELQFFKSEMKYIEKVEKINCEIGDKFVILDVDKILHAESSGFENGVPYEVFKILEDGSPVLKHDTNGRELYFYKREFKYIKKVEKTMYKKGDKLLRTGGSNQFYKKGKEYEILEVVHHESVDSYIRIQQECSRGIMNVKDIMKNFELVKDDSVPPYETGDKIVFTDISNVGGASRAILTVGKVYEVLEWKGYEVDRHVEHFIIKNNNGKEFVVRYDEFKYVKKVSELESEMYIRIAPSNHKFNIGEKYEGVEFGDYIIFNFNIQGRQQSYAKTNIHEYFKKLSTDTDAAIHEYKHQVKVGDRFLRTGSSGSMFENGRIYSVYRVDVGGAWLVGDNGQQGFYVFSMLNDPEYFVSVDESERLREELEIKEKEIESKEKEIAALKAKIRILQPLPVRDVNEERKIIIHRAKKFISEYLNDETQKHYDYDMIYTESRRMVTVLIKYPSTNKIYLKGQSICAKGDVFNLYIGRAIALGRALGIDVSYFENAVQPELAIGQIVKTKNAYAKKWQISKVVSRQKHQEEGRKLADDEQFLYYLHGYDMTTSEKKVGILEDTNAQY